MFSSPSLHQDGLWQSGKAVSLFLAVEEEVQNIQHSRGQCRGSALAESSSYSAFSSVSLWAVLVCAPLAARSQMSTLKCQNCLLNASARSHGGSPRMRSRRTLSPGGLRRSVLETHPSHFTAPDCCNSPASHAEGPQQQESVGGQKLSPTSQWSMSGFITFTAEELNK